MLIVSSSSSCAANQCFVAEYVWALRRVVGSGVVGVTVDKMGEGGLVKHMRA